tara:strand:+ start:1214 stop:1849 length:636 start_codon:yes stop_codon:yes gene_type:complete
MFQKLRKKLKGRSGQSLAEFAVTTAMMATLATTAAPKFSGVGEGAKEKKTLADIDKIVKSANNFYNEKVTSEGRGRFPGQVKYNESVPDGGGYQDEASVVAGLNVFETFESSEASKWASIFGTQNQENPMPSGASVNTAEDPDNDGSFSETVGAEEFLNEFGGNAVKSPFQDGHYIYTVIAGGGSGQSSYSPILYVADLESPANFRKKLQP